MIVGELISFQLMLLLHLQHISKWKQNPSRINSKPYWSFGNDSWLLHLISDYNSLTFWAAFRIYSAYSIYNSLIPHIIRHLSPFIFIYHPLSTSYGRDEFELLNDNGCFVNFHPSASFGIPSRCLRDDEARFDLFLWWKSTTIVAYMQVDSEMFSDHYDSLTINNIYIFIPHGNPQKPNGVKVWPFFRL